MTIAGRYFTHAEMVRSSTAARLEIDNAPSPAAEAELQALVDEVLDPLRELLGRPCRITSGYRGIVLNRAIGSRDTSQHIAGPGRGAAADLKADRYSAREVLALIHQHTEIPVDQAIGYHPSRGGHVHVSHAIGRDARREFRWAPADGGYHLWWPT